MKNKIKTSPFMLDVILTSITSVLTICSFIVVTRWLADGLGPEKFGAYSLVRRILSTIEPFSTLGMGVTLARYIAIENNENSRANYFLGGFLSVFLACSMIIIIGLAFKNLLTQVIFHSHEYHSLFLSMLFLIAGYSFYVILYACYRGLGQMGKANLWQLAEMAIIPIFIVIAYARSLRVDLIVFLLGMFFFLAIIPLIFFMRGAIKKIKDIGLFSRDQVKGLLNYSLPRIPTQFAFGGILMIGPFFAPYLGGIKDAGYLVVSQSLLRVVEGGIEGFSRVVLPAAARMVAEGRQEFLKLRVNDLIAFIFHVGMYATIHLFLWSNQIVSVWLGDLYLDVIPIMKATILAILPFIAYSMLRSIIDAIEEKAVNATNLYVAFSSSLLISLILGKVGLGILGLAIGMSVGFWILGILTVHFLWKRFEIGTRVFYIKESIYLNIIFIIISWLLKYWLEISLSGIKLLGTALAGETLFFFLYCFILWKLSINWTIELMERMVQVAPGFKK